MKIKTITCHNVYNTGASLQAYALATYLKNLQHDVEIIDYVPEYLRHYKLTGVGNSKYDKLVLREIYQILKLPSRVKARYGKRKAEFDRFTAKYLPLTKEYYSSFKELCSKPPMADLIFAGSDQIWNTIFQNGKDPAFYLQFARKDCVKASYAASFATECVEEQCKAAVVEWLSEMDHISVREKTGIKILKELGINKGIQVMDPVFLLDKEEWEKMAQVQKYTEPYLLLYDFDNRKDLAEYARKIANKNGWKVYSFLKSQYADKCFENEGPEAFLALIKQAQMIVSNSFHATAFSLIFEKQFVVIKRLEGINTRMEDLLSELGIPHRLIDLNDMEKMITDIDYSNIKILLDASIKKSKDYISYVISEVERKNEKENIIRN